MSPTLVTFLFEAANFLVLAAVLSWLFFKPVRQALESYRAKFEADKQLAAEQLASAEQTKKAIESAHANLQSELNELRESEISAARAQAQQLLADARSAAQREIAEARQQASRMSDLQRDRLAEVSATAASQTVGHLLKQIGGSDLRTALIESACKQLEATPSQSLGSVKVESSEPLSPAQLARLREAIGGAADAADFRTVEGLGDGVRISTSRGLIDATVKGLVEFASQALVNDMGRLGNNHRSFQKVNDV